MSAIAYPGIPILIGFIPFVLSSIVGKGDFTDVKSCLLVSLSFLIWSQAGTIIIIRKEFQGLIIRYRGTAAILYGLILLIFGLVVAIFTFVSCLCIETIACRKPFF